MRIFYVSFILLLVSVQVKSQDRLVSTSNAPVKIIKFYPNPATSVINFDFQKGYDKSYSFLIFNFLGKKVYEANNLAPKTTVNLNDFYRGIYIFQLRDKNGRVIDSGKFQVSK